MFCPNCGTNYTEGSKFCPGCGCDLSEYADMSDSIETETPDAAVDEGGYTDSDDSVTGKSTKKKYIGIGIAAAVVVVAVILVVKGGILGSIGGGGGDAYVYHADETYSLITNLNKGNTLEIESSRIEDYDVSGSMVQFSSDGKYVYFYTKYDSDSGTGTLCRAQYGKLKEDSGKNDKYIEKIASDVNLGFTLLEDGSLFYRDDDDTLYYYDGKESEKVARDVVSYYADEDGRVVYKTGSSEDGYDLYGVKIKDLDNEIELASDCASVYSMSDPDHILYTMYEDGGQDEDEEEDEEENENDGSGEYTYSLYVVGFDTEAEKLGEGASVVTSASDGVYYTVAGGETLNLYDYVTDDAAASDADLKEPDIEDYEIQSYNYNKLNSKSDISDYDEIYTSCTAHTYFMSSSSMEYEVEKGGTYADNYQWFCEKYADQQNSDGYLVVTDDVKADLVTLAKAVGDGDKNEWLEFCFYRTQSSYTTYDYEKYYEDLDAYDAASVRISLREELQDEDNAFAVSSLCYYSDGKTTVISENVLDAESCTGGVIYNTADMITDLPELSEIYSVSEVTDLFYVDNAAQNYLIANGETKAYQVSESLSEELLDLKEDTYGVSLYLQGSDLFVNDGEGGLYISSASGSSYDSMEEIATDAAIALVTSDVVYYYGDEDEGSDGMYYADLYSYSGGKATCMAEDVVASGFRVYEDGNFLAYTDYSDSRGYEYTLFSEDGEKIWSEDDKITQFIRLDKSTLLYISDGDLYVYNGKESTRIDRDVDYVWSRNYVNVTASTTY
ncbi:MAG: zinc ribbon domain-containing protein [Clostridiales bacterium]|nr:zinc ribbon domain-containing protein [Clostridiales bacterium]